MAKVKQFKWQARGPLGKRVAHVGWGYTLMVNGKRERKFSSAWTSEADAMQALSDRQQQIRAGQIDRPADVTLRELTQRYLTYKAQTGKRSLKDDRRILENRLLPAFGPSLPVRQLRADRIARYEADRIGEVSAYTVANELSILRHLLRLGCKWGCLERAPEIELPKKPGGRERYLTEEEIHRLLSACTQSRNPYLWTIVVLAINTGMRRGEILGLTWERVSLEKDLGFNARITLYKTKNGKPRGVPLNQAAIDALARVEPDPEKRTGPVFKDENGKAWGKIRTAFELAVIRADIPDFRFHDLRHTCASWLVMKGRSLREVQEVLGHGDLRMTNRYAHLSPAHLRSAVEVLNGLTPAPSTRHTPADDLADKLADRHETNQPQNTTA